MMMTYSSTTSGRKCTTYLEILCTRTSDHESESENNTRQGQEQSKRVVAGLGQDDASHDDVKNNINDLLNCFIDL